MQFLSHVPPDGRQREIEKWSHTCRINIKIRLRKNNIKRDKNEITQKKADESLNNRSSQLVSEGQYDYKNY